MFDVLGYAILSVLITDLDPDERVRNGNILIFSPHTSHSYSCTISYHFLVLHTHIPQL